MSPSPVLKARKHPWIASAAHPMCMTMPSLFPSFFCSGLLSSSSVAKVLPAMKRSHFPRLNCNPMTNSAIAPSPRAIASIEIIGKKMESSMLALPKVRLR